VIDIQVPQEMVDDRLVNGVHALAPCPSYQTQNWDGSIPPIKYIGQIVPSENWDGTIPSLPVPNPNTSQKA